jgi:hypothetical protein
MRINNGLDCLYCLRSAFLPGGLRVKSKRGCNGCGQNFTLVVFLFALLLKTVLTILEVF